MVQSLPGQIVPETLSQKTLSQRNWAGGVAQGVDLEFKSQYCKKKKKVKFVLFFFTAVKTKSISTKKGNALSHLFGL
jgi:hypothetical protein